MGYFSRIKRKLCRSVEDFIFSSHINIFATIWINFRLLSWRDASKFPIVVYGKIRLLRLSGAIEIAGPVSFGMITVNKPSLRPGNTSRISELVILGRIRFDGNARFGGGGRLLVLEQAILDIGNDVLIAENFHVSCFKKIVIGQGARIAHEVQIMDSNFHFILDLEARSISSHTRQIVLGDKCWVGNRTTIGPGTVIPNNCIIASASLVAKNYSECGENVLLGGCPAKLIRKDVRRVWSAKEEVRLYHFFLENSDKTTYDLCGDEDVHAYG